MIQEIRVRTTIGPDVKGASLLYEVRRLGITTIVNILTTRIYRLESLTAEEADRFARIVLVESINQTSSLNQPLLPEGGTVIEVAYKPGVMNPEAASLMKLAENLGFPLCAVDSSTEYGFYGTPTEEERRVIADRLLVNKIVQQIVTNRPETLLFQGDYGEARTIPIRTMNDAELVALSKDKLSLNLEEMRVIQAHFRTLDREPFDVEIETLAQTWSEHCGHKTFHARIIVDGKEKPPLMRRLKDTARLYFGDFVLSAFGDNSGVFSFYEGQAVCGKVETHNSPSAIEPYGGAATGSGGVFRDVMGTGQGARVIASTDIFCLAPPDLPQEELPPGCLNPNYLLRNVVRGVQDYGNRMGIPTANGSLHFHRDFRAKPTVIVGAYGIIPADQCQQGIPQVGDKIIAVGGRTGRDGIHGATFSSGEMTERTVSVNANAVQIGNAIEEKRTSDALLVCREERLIRAITDCGAGGFSSAIGEMTSKLGVRVELENAPLKYQGLDPWEIWISESQERMVIAIAPEHVARVYEICHAHNVEATTLGELTEDHKLTVTLKGIVVCDLDMEFLHHGLPQRVMHASPKTPELSEPTIPFPTDRNDWRRIYREVMGHLNVCSREPIVRLYDHGVQGSNVLPPYGGINHDGPSDATVLTPILGKPYGLVLSHGLNPVLNQIDPYWGSIWAITEAVANLAAVGGNYREAGLIDNFIWPVPDEESLGSLDLAIDACVDAMNVLKRPFISGKDSLSSTYRGGGTVVKIPPVLCVSAFGRIPDVRRTVTADFKFTGSKIVLLGKMDPEAMGGSVYYDTHGHLGNRIPRVDLPNLPHLLDRLYQAIHEGYVTSCHDLSEGGVAVALAEMCFGGDKGAWIDLKRIGEGRPDFLFFNEMAGTFLLETRTDETSLAVLFDGLPWSVIGDVRNNPHISISYGENDLFSVGTQDLKTAWQAPMKEVFHS